MSAAAIHHFFEIEIVMASKRGQSVRSSRQVARNIENNRHIIKCCAESILFCGRQGIALRGDTEKLDKPGNPGNFLAFLKEIAKRDPLLKDHLEHPRLKNATYISPRIQNELIDVLGRDIIQKGLVDSVKQAKFYSIMADEITSFNKEIMPLCVRYCIP